MATELFNQGPRVIGIRLSDVKPERVSWRSRGRFARGKLTIVDGDPGLGKSTMLLDLAAKVTRGEGLPDGDPSPERGVVIVAPEDGIADTIRPRMDLLGADCSHVMVVETTYGTEGERMIQFPADVDVLEGVILAMDAGFVIIDSVDAVMGDGLKPNSSTDVRKAFLPLARMAERTGATIILIRHLNKSGGTNALYRGTGSIAFIGIARFGLLVAEDPDDPAYRVLSQSKGNIGPPAESLRWRLVGDATSDHARVEWCGTSKYSSKHLLMNGSADDQESGPEEKDEAAGWLMSRLSGGSVPSTQVFADAKRAGFGERSVKRAKVTLAVKAEKHGFGGDSKWVWRLPGT